MTGSQGDCMELLFEVEKKNNFTIFKPVGELNYEGALRLKQVFQDAFALGDQAFILDLKGCKTISSFALSVILKLNDTIKEKKGIFNLVCPRGDVSDIFDVIDISNVIPIFPTEEELWRTIAPE
jgi:anti-anti-sigma factor